jgi:hypothetical protein
LALNAYTGSPIPATYSADSYWLAAIDCNGYIVPSTTPAAIAGCSKGSELRDMAAGLGVVGNTPQNHAVAAHTDRPTFHPGVDKVEFQTLPTDPIVLAGQNRYIVFSVDVAVTNCQSNDPSLMFFLLDGGTEVPAFSNAINPCGKSNTAALVQDGSTRIWESSTSPRPSGY